MRHIGRQFALLVVILAPALAGAAELRGRVTGPAGEPVAGATVVVSAEARSWRTSTGSDGGFALPLPKDVPRSVLLRVSAPGFQDVELTVVELTRTLEVKLAPLPLFSDRVEVTALRAQAGETPVTLTNVTRADIERDYWGQDVAMFLSQVPGFYAYSDNGQGIGYSYFQLRGFDMRRTAVSLNGVPLNDAHEHSVYFIDLADFLDTTGDIQVQRGVGTNLYGGSAIGGSVDLLTRAPLAERRLQVSTLAGAWDTRRFTVEYDSGLSSDGWAATFRWSKVDSGGYRDQSWTRMWNYFMTVEHYGERSTLRVLLFGGPEDTHLAYDGVPRAYLDGEITGDRRRDRRFNPLTYPNEVDHFLQPHYQLLHSWQISDTLRLENTLFCFTGDGYFEQFGTDQWMPEYDLEPFAGPGGQLIDTTDLVSRREVNEWDGGWIPSLEWSQDGGLGTLEAGTAVHLHHSHHFGYTTWAQYYPPDLPPNHRYYDYQLGKRSLQPFLQETWRFGEQWTALAGLTWTSHRYEMSHDQLRGVAFDESFSYLLPRLGLTFKPAPGWSLYGNVSRGGREPAFRDIYDPQDYWGERVKLAPEKLNDFELGGERRWEAGYARLNVYWLHFDSEIVWAGGLDNNGEPVTANGAVTNHRGVELEVAWTPLPRWGARLGLACAKNTFGRFVEYDSEGHGTDQSGNWIAGTPDWLASLELTGGAGPVDAVLSLRHAGRFFLDNTENMRRFPEIRNDPSYVDRVNDPFTVVDLALKVDVGRSVADLIGAHKVLVNLQANNLTDALYTTFGYVEDAQPLWTPAATRSVYGGLTVDW